jgi:photosystem II stability/assembly factor-like uncharacterized protein
MKFVSRFKRPLLLLLIALVISNLTLMPASSNIKASSDGKANGKPAPLDWKITGPTGGDVRSLVVDPKDPDHFYFGTIDGHIYTSSDACKTWSLFYNFNRPRLYVDNIIIDPRDSRIMYVGTHRHKEPGGVYITKDRGVTWREVPELKNESILSMSQMSEKPDVLAAGTVSGVFRSMNGGETWTRINQEGQNPYHVESIVIDPRSADVIYAGTWYLPYKTTDGGKSWKNVKQGMIDDSDVFAIDINVRDPNHIFASACSGIYESKDGANSWRKVQGIPSQARRTRAILQHPTVQGVVLAGTTEGFWRTGDGGDSWMVTTSRELEINAIAVHPSRPDYVYISTNNYGVMISSDGGKTFAPSNEGYSGRFAKAILVDREQPNRIYATTINTTKGGGFFFVSEDGGYTWKPSMRNLPNRIGSYSIFQDEADANILYLATDLGIYRSQDRGASWSAVVPEKASTTNGKKPTGKSSKATTASKGTKKKASGPDPIVKQVQEALNAAGESVGKPDGKLGALTQIKLKAYQTKKCLPATGVINDATLVSLGIKPSTDEPIIVPSLTCRVNQLISTFDERDGKPGIMAATDGGLYRAYDISKGWEKLHYPQDIPIRTTCISISLQAPETIWAGINAGLLVSRDGGKTWQKVAGVPDIGPISAIAQDPNNPARVFVGTVHTFYRSFDNGATWERRGGGLRYGNYSSILINPKNENEIYVGDSAESGGGIYRSINGGTTWTRIDQKDAGLPSQRIWALVFDQTNTNRIFVASHSAGIYVAEYMTASAGSGQ